MYYADDILDLERGILKDDVVPIDYVTDSVVIHQGLVRPSKYDILPHIFLTQFNVLKHKLHVIGNKWQNPDLL